MKKKSKTPLITKVEINEEIKAEPVVIDSAIEPPVLEKKNNFLFVAGSVVALLILIGIGVLGWLYINQDNKKEAVTISPAPTPEVTVLESIVLEKDKIVFEVFNATNTKGEAKKYKDRLEKLGFKVEKVGNESGSFKGVVVLIPKELEKQKDLLITEIKKEIPLVTDGGDNKESTTKVKLIIGN